MLKILSGKLKKRKINTLPISSNTGMIPTSTKVRAAIFNSLGPYFSGGIFLELFGGTGIISFEAISRGIKRSIYVEKNKKIFNNFKKNIERLQITNVDLYCNDYKKILTKIETKVDYIFIDPPYNTSNILSILNELINSKIVTKNTIFILEFSSKIYNDKIIDFFKEFYIKYKKKFGKTMIIIYSIK